MPSHRIFPSLLTLALLWAAFFAYVWWSAPQLPERVATHFDWSGRPNGWMTRAGYVRFTLIVGTGTSAFMLGVFRVIRRCRGWGLNIPNKDYWLASERRQATYDFIQRQGVWLAALMLVFFAGVHRSILTANARSPVALPANEVGWLAGGFGVFAIAWTVVVLGRFFRRRP